MNDGRVQRYAAMWTSDVGRYGLLELDASRAHRWLIFDLQTLAPIAFDDDEDVVASAFENTRRAGARVLTAEEARPK